VLQTPPQARTPEDIEFLQKETQEIAFFKNYIEKGDPDGNTNIIYHSIVDWWAYLAYCF